MATGLKQSVTQQDPNRMQPVDIVRAMAIVFVVLGHALIYAKCGNFLMECIYSFHMALLFLLSGFVTAASWERSVAADPRLALRKVGRSARRLLVPYAICGIMVIPTVNYLLTERMAASFVHSWRGAFLLNRFLWYLPCCFFLVCIFVAVALFLRRTHGIRWLIGVCAAFALVVTAYLLMPGVDYTRSVMSYFASFFTGAWLWSYRDTVLNPGRRLLAISLIAFAVLAVLYASMSAKPLVVRGVIKPLAGISALFILMAVANKMRGIVASSVAYVGRTTLFLYCFDYFATPIAIQFFHSAGILSSFAVTFGVIAVGIFVNFVWEYFILPELGSQFQTKEN